MEIQILNLYLCCKVKQFICTCKLFCKNPANYQLCIRFHLNFIKRWRRVWRMLSTGKTTFRDRSHSVSAIRTAVLRRRSSSTGRGSRSPEGDAEPVSDLVPVWWEFHTFSAEGRNAERFRFFRDEALCLIPAVGMSCRRCGQPPDPRFASGRPRPQAVRPPAPPPRSFRHFPSLARRSRRNALFLFEPPAAAPRMGSKISTNGLEIQLSSAEADSAEVFVPAGILAPDYPANSLAGEFCSAIRFPAIRFPANHFPANHFPVHLFPVHLFPVICSPANLSPAPRFWLPVLAAPVPLRPVSRRV